MAGYGDERLAAELSCRVTAGRTAEEAGAGPETGADPGADPGAGEGPCFDEVRIAFRLELAPSDALRAAIEAATRPG